MPAAAAGAGAGRRRWVRRAGSARSCAERSTSSLGEEVEWLDELTPVDRRRLPPEPHDYRLVVVWLTIVALLPLQRDALRRHARQNRLPNGTGYLPLTVELEL